MPLFRCMTCGCADNTALTNYWERRYKSHPLLYAACDPDIGTWHDRFPRRSAVGLLIDQDGNLWHPRQLMGMPKGCEIVGIVQEEAPYDDKR